VDGISAGKKLIEDVAALIPDHKPGVSIGWILPASLKCSARPVTWRAVRHALKHLVDEGKISSPYCERPPDVYYISKRRLTYQSDG
jgi:hypothetical protein